MALPRFQSLRSVIRYGLPVTVSAVLAACSGQTPVEPTATSTDAQTSQAGDAATSAKKPKETRLSMKAGEWDFRFSPGMPAHPRGAKGGWAFDFPHQDGVHYLVTDQRTPAPAQSITAVIEIDTTGTPYFDYRTEDFNTCESPSKVRLFVQRRGDDMSGAGAFEFYRWWSTAGVYELADGRAALVGDVTTPAAWTSVFGKSGADNEPAFRAALADIGHIGFTFGGGCFYGHGVFVTPGTGEAVFSATEFTIR